MLRAWAAETKETWTAPELLGSIEQDLSLDYLTRNFSNLSDNVDVILETDRDSFINYTTSMRRRTHGKVSLHL